MNQSILKRDFTESEREGGAGRQAGRMNDEGKKDGWMVITASNRISCDLDKKIKH